MLKRQLFAFAITAAISTDAAAQWINRVEDDPFSTKKSSIGMTMANGYGFGFRCDSSDDYAIVYLTTELAKDSAVAMNLLSPTIKIRVDDNTIREISASVDEAGGKLRLLAVGEDALAVVKEMSAARKRIAVAVEIVGQRFHTQTFGVSGSQAALSKTLAAWAIKPE